MTDTGGANLTLTLPPPPNNFERLIILRQIPQITLTQRNCETVMLNNAFFDRPLTSVELCTPLYTRGYQKGTN